MRFGAFCLLAAAIFSGSLPTRSNAAVVWDESVNGNLSADQTQPTVLTMTAGTNSVIGTVGSIGTTVNKQDWITFAVPTGDVLGSILLGNFQSTDTEGFMGVQAGTSFVGNSQTAQPYLGYVHYGTGATNGTIPATNLIGQDLLSLMGDTTLAPGSQGFTPPLPAGNYTFLIQQSGALTSYQFDFVITPAPEPASLLTLLAGLLVMGRRVGRRI